MRDRILSNQVWIEIVVVAGVSFGLYLLSTGFFLFLIPLQVLYIRRGSSSFNLAVLLLVSLAGFVALTGSFGNNLEKTAENYLQSIQIFLSAVLLGGLWLMNSRHALPYRPLVRLLAATIVVGLIVIPFISRLVNDPAFAPVMRTYISSQPMLQRTIGVGNNDGQMSQMGVEISKTEIEQYADFFGELVLRFVLLLYLFYLLSAWWLGSVWGARTVRRKSPIGKIIAFRLEPWCLWGFLLSGIGLLGNFLIQADLGVLKYAAPNIFSVLAFLYALQGLGVLRWLYRRYQQLGAIRTIVTVVLIIMFLRLNLMIIPIAGLTLLGISETWIDFKRPKVSDDAAA